MYDFKIQDKTFGRTSKIRVRNRLHVFYIALFVFCEYGTHICSPIIVCGGWAGNGAPTATEGTMGVGLGGKAARVRGETMRTNSVFGQCGRRYAGFVIAESLSWLSHLYYTP